MTIIITMAGQGSRFKAAGFSIPKYMIEVRGKTLFDWSMESLEDYNKIVKKYIFVVQKKDNSKQFILEHMDKFNIGSIEVLELEEATDGQATTCMKAMDLCDADDSIMIYNIDTYVESGGLLLRAIEGDGFIPCFKAPGLHWSFVRVDDDGQVVEVREKERISDNCSIGAYFFKSAKLFIETYNSFYKVGNITREKYIAPMYNALISKGYKVNMNIISSNLVHVLGTPEEVDSFKNLD